MSMTHLARDIATSRLHHKASFVSKAQYADVIADLREIAGTKPDVLKTQFEAGKLDTLAAFGYQPVESFKPFAYADGVAIIPIHGLLINRLSWSCSYATGYNFIRSQRNAALADPDVQLIVYDVNSPGGIASGCAELSQEMFDSRGEKPSLAVVDARCFSAAYFLASAADRIVVTPSGGVGSIGCVVMHVDVSGMFDQDGIKITFIDAPEGGDKVQGNPYEPLSSKAKASIQTDVDYHYGLFLQAVARNRGLSEDEIRATKAGCFNPPEALDLGLIDAIETPAQAVANFFNEITTDAEGDDNMDTKNTSGSTAAPAAAPAAMTQADVASAVAAALSADRTRQAGIRTSDEAKGREKLADHLALNTDLTVDQSKAILTAAPVEKPAAEQQRASGFAAAMDGTQNPNIAPDSSQPGPGQGEDETPQAKADRLLATWGKASGKVIDLKRSA